MEIFNIDQHRACHCYDSAKLSQVEVRKIGRTETGEISFSRNEIVFIMEGKLRFSLRDNPGGELRKGQVVFLSAGDRLNYKATARSMVLIVRLNGKINLCHTFSVERIYNKFRKEAAPLLLAPLEINPHLWNFANGLTAVVADGLMCRYFFEAKITELLLLIRMFYSDRELFGFFYPVLSPDAQFAEFVRVNFLKYSTVSEMAAAQNMTPKQFARRFNNVFNQTPHQWMQQEKARLIYHEVCESDKPLKEIASDYGYDIQANFNRFCMEAYGMSPGQIRKKNQGKGKNDK